MPIGASPHNKFYKKLFGGELEPRIHLHQKCWREREEDSSEDDNERITRKFTMELEKAVREMKTNTVPGRDGLTVSFCKKF